MKKELKKCLAYEPKERKTKILKAGNISAGHMLYLLQSGTDAGLAVAQLSCPVSQLGMKQ